MRTALLSFLILIATMSFKNDDTDLLYHLVKHPKLQSNKTPLLILLHGIGSNEKDLFSFADQLPDNLLVISARAPYEMGYSSYAWFDADFSSAKPVFNKEMAEKSRNLIIKFIDQLKQKYIFDDTQVYLCGFSQGAIMAYSAGLTHPEKIKGIVAMSGRVLEEIKPLIKPDERLKDLKIFISHGTKDNIIGVNYARDGRKYLKSIGITPTYKEYPVGHTISAEMLSDLISWLKDQTIK